MVKNKNNKKYILIVVISVVLAGLIYLYISRNKKNEAVQPISTAKTTSTAPTAQEGFTGGKDREPGNTLSENKGSATVTDNNGRANNATDSDKWQFSKSGDITVYSPVSGQLVSSGAQISGKTSLNNINFRIIDDISGVLATGKLNVVKGKFSGTIDFQSNADKGRIDVFGALDSGKEFSNIEIPVKFK